MGKKLKKNDLKNLKIFKDISLIVNIDQYVK